MKSNKFILFIFIILIYIFFKAYIFSSKYESDKYSKQYVVLIESKIKETDTKVSYNVLAVNKDEFNANITNKKNIFKDKFVLNISKSLYGKNIDLNKYSNLQYGDVIKLKGKIVIPEFRNNPGEFNYKKYLYSNNIYGEINTYEDATKISHSLNLKEKLLQKIYLYKEELSDKLEKNMSEKNSSVAKSIIYGETISLNEETRIAFKEVGVSHLMAISGANIVSLVTVISVVLGLLKIKGKYKNVISIIIVNLFVILVGGSLSSMRAGIMCSVPLFAKMFSKEISSFKCILIAALIILVYAPFSIYNVGCILSFLATLGIMLFNKYLNGLTEKKINKIQNKYIKKIVSEVASNFWITIAVQITILPVQVNSFNSFSSSLILSNILCSLIMTPITLIGSIFILVAKIPYISSIVVFALQILIEILMNLLNILKILSIDITLMSIPSFLIAIYYLIVLMFWVKIKLYGIYLRKNKIKIDKSGENNKLNETKKSWKKFNIYLKLLVVIYILLIIIYNLWWINFSEVIYFFNVDQGEMSYIKAGKESIIVDIGSVNNTLAFNTIKAYFTKQNISKVDVILISHMHTDHVNGLEKFLETYDVNLIVYAKPFLKTDVYNKFLELVKKHNIATKVVEKNHVIKLNNIRIDILLPLESLISNKEDLNANSIVCKVKVKDKQLLYMGDATKETEKVLLKSIDNNMLKNIDILKVGHHGSKTATSEKFIQKVSPTIAIISAKQKYYGHPHESVIDILKMYKVQIYLTEKNGAIKFSI